MKINYNYSNENKEIELPGKLNLQIIEPKEVPGQNEQEVIQQSLAEKLPLFLKNVNRLLIIVNDGTRATPTAKVIEAIYTEIKKLSVTFLVALGTHRKPTQEEFEIIFGRFFQIYQDRIFCHDAQKAAMVTLGTTTRGNQVKINRLAVEHDKILIISSLEPHYFAGYTGGRKSILPGIAAYETIEKNHSFALLPEAKVLQLESNPVHEDMLEAAALLPTETWACLLVTDKNHHIFASTFDLTNKAFFNSIPFVDQVYKVPVKQQADIVIACVEPPLDMDLYQSQKAIENARNAIKEDGIFILISACQQGIGNDSFYRLLSSCSNPDEVYSKIQKEYKLGYHKAAKFVDFMQKYQLWIISDIPSQQLEKIFLKSKPNLHTAITEALRIKGETARILFVRDAGTIVPNLK